MKKEMSESKFKIWFLASRPKTLPAAAAPVVIGTSMAFASDIAPHWGAGFMKWNGYDRFWIQTIRWLGEK